MTVNKLPQSRHRMLKKARAYRRVMELNGGTRPKSTSDGSVINLMIDITKNIMKHKGYRSDDRDVSEKEPEEPGRRL